MNHANNPSHAIKVYLVGGAVRDTLLGLPVHDKDFVVVGASFDEMKSLGFVQVGVDFPVFLHPDTHFEYALARIERKNGTGYQGFATETRGVSLAEDLCRRDLTINALAIEVNGLFDDTLITGEVIDFYGGVNDLNQKTLRHISPAFCEDPLRILRTVRFLARYAGRGFQIADETIALMQTMAKAGELNHLSRERFWAESVKAMESGTGHLYWQNLKYLAILPHFLPDLDQAWQDKQVFERSIRHLDSARDQNIAVQFAILCNANLDDTKSNQDLTKKTAQCLNAPKHPTHIAELLSEFADLFKNPPTSQAIIALIEKTKAHQGNERTLEDVLRAICIIHQDVAFETLWRFLTRAIDIHKSINIKDIDQNLKGKEIGLALTNLRMTNIQTLIDDVFDQ